MTAAATLHHLPELTPKQAESWVAAALAEARALRQYDEQLYPPASDQEALGVARELHRAWGDWLAEAQALAERLRPLMAAKPTVEGAEALETAMARARAVAGLTPDSMNARRDQVARGEVKSIEEVRRELFPSAGR